jgi:hypothetical protein
MINLENGMLYYCKAGELLCLGIPYWVLFIIAFTAAVIFWTGYFFGWHYNRKVSKETGHDIVELTRGYIGVVLISLAIWYRWWWVYS